MAAIIVKLECLTNLHVGNGDVNYNVIDNEVEKDPVTGLPTINASGVKGALRSYFEKIKAGKDDIVDWFGSDSKEKNDHRQGKLKILNANLLAMPLRATDGSNPYHLVTTDENLKQYESLCSAFGLSKAIGASANTAVGEAVEGYSLKGAKKETIEGVSGIYVVSDEETKKNLRRVQLPVLARNYLENGTSKNLWYEEVVPHESVFYFFVITDDSDKGYLNSFAEKIKDKVIQFGGNASIGYGLCKVSVREA